MLRRPVAVFTILSAASTASAPEGEQSVGVGDDAPTRQSGRLVVEPDVEQFAVDDHLVARRLGAPWAAGVAEQHRVDGVDRGQPVVGVELEARGAEPDERREHR